MQPGAQTPTVRGRERVATEHHANRPATAVAAQPQDHQPGMDEALHQTAIHPDSLVALTQTEGDILSGIDPQPAQPLPAAESGNAPQTPCQAYADHADKSQPEDHGYRDIEQQPNRAYVEAGQPGHQINRYFYT